ncbi:MAG: hypothetical protein K2X04_02765 [Burkholderiales bacterium]|nr:hypothetical protein [Burkholderiales bacterium]
MRKLLILSLILLAKFSVAAVVINYGHESLFLGNDNVSCGRYTLVNGSSINDVLNYCTVVGRALNSDGEILLRVKTEEAGIVDCYFLNGKLDQCYIDD